MRNLRLFALLDQLRLARHPVPAELLSQRLRPRLSAGEGLLSATA